MIKKIILSQGYYFPANIYLFRVNFEHISHLFGNLLVSFLIPFFKKLSRLYIQVS